MCLMQEQHATTGRLDLGMLESQIVREKNRACFAVGAVLLEISSRRLYKERGFNTFRVYVTNNAQRLGFDYKTAERWIRAVKMLSLLPEGAPRPGNMYHLLGMQELPDNVIGQCWLQILSFAKGDPLLVTATMVKKAVGMHNSRLHIGNTSTMEAEPSQKACVSSTVLRDSNLQAPAMSCKWYTPKLLLDGVRDLFGGPIELDPCSDATAQASVKAKQYFSIDQDGLDLGNKWHGDVFVNPPYSLATSGVGMQELFLQRAVTEYDSGNIKQCILLLKCAVGYRWFDTVMGLPHCLLKERVAFVDGHADPNGACGHVASFGSVLCYIGPNVDRFVQVFQCMGHIPGHSSWAVGKK
jgi:hypothetical protein